MPTVFLTDSAGAEHIVHADAGDSVMQAVVHSGAPGIIGECGGALACSTCHVFVAPEDTGKLSEMDEMEDEMLDGTVVERQSTSRLACQIKLAEGMELHVTTPEEQ